MRLKNTIRLAWDQLTRKLAPSPPDSSKKLSEKSVSDIQSRNMYVSMCSPMPAFDILLERDTAAVR